MIQRMLQQDSKDNSMPILFRDNPLLVQLLGLSPLLAVSHTLTYSLALGLVFTLIFLITSLLVSASRDLIPQPVSLVCYVFISGSLITIIDLCLQAYRPELRNALGIYLPIVAANGLLLDRLRVHASRHPVLPVLYSALLHALAIMLVLILLGSTRELIAYGTLLNDLHLLTGSELNNPTPVFDTENRGLRLAILPAGAFISLGCLIALKNYLYSSRSAKSPH